MPMDPNSPSYIKEELYKNGSSSYLQETIVFESHLTRNIANASVKENVVSNGLGKWIYKTNNYSGTVTNFDESDIINRQGLYVLSPSSDVDTTLSLNFKIPKYSSYFDTNHSLDLTFLPSFKNTGTIKNLEDPDLLVLNDDYTSGRASYFVLDFWFKIPSFNSSIFYMSGWPTDYIWKSQYDNIPNYSSGTLEPSIFQIGVTDFFDGKKRLICHVGKHLRGYIHDQESLDWAASLPENERLYYRDLIFFIDNDIPINQDEWHHIVIKATGRPYPNYSKDYPIPTVRIWFDDHHTFTANNIVFRHYNSNSYIFYYLDNDTQKMNPETAMNPTVKFALSNRIIGENTAISQIFVNFDKKIHNADITSDISKYLYLFNETFFPDLSNPNRFYNAPNTTINYSDLFDVDIGTDKSLSFKDLKYSTIYLKSGNFSQSKTDFNITIETEPAYAVEQDILNPVTISIPNELTPVDILNPVTIQVKEDLAQDILNPVTISIPTKESFDLLNPVTISISQPITPIDPFEITVTTISPFKPIEEVEDFINKRYLGTQQAAEDFQLLMKVTETSYWPVEFTIDNNYHIHIKPDPIYIGASLYACTNKQFLYHKYAIT